MLNEEILELGSLYSSFFEILQGFFWGEISIDKGKSKRIPHRKTVRFGINGPENIRYILNIARDGNSIESPRIYGRDTKINIY